MGRVLRIQSPATLRRKRAQQTAKALPEPVPPSSPYIVDVVIPFHAGDAHYVPECVNAIMAQRYVTPRIHLIADGCDVWPDSPSRNPLDSESRATIYRYTHNQPPGQGPYRLTNALVAGGHCLTPWLAIQDADDISLPDRLWRQISLLNRTGAQMISSAAENFVGGEHTDNSELQKRLNWEPIVQPGRVYETVPRGRCVNTLRTMTLSLFQQMNGFADFFCTGDFDFDNRCRFAGVRIIDDQTILGRRRLQPQSLTNGLATMESPRRQQDMRRLQRNLNIVRRCRRIECAAKVGGLQKTFALNVARLSESESHAEAV